MPRLPPVTTTERSAIELNIILLFVRDPCSERAAAGPQVALGELAGVPGVARADLLALARVGVRPHPGHEQQPPSKSITLTRSSSTSRLANRRSAWIRP